MTELEFISRIDGCFPYYDIAESERLIRHGCSISSNSTFMVVAEVVKPPTSATVTRERRLALLRQVGSHFDHPLKDLVLGIAERVVGGDGLSLLETLDGMRAIASFHHQYCALSVVYSSAIEPWPEVDSLYNQIVEHWNAMA